MTAPQSERRLEMRALIADAVASTIPPKPGYPIGSFPKTCLCCGREYTAAQWSELINPRAWDLRPDGDLLEIRECECKSTISVELER